MYKTCVDAKPDQQQISIKLIMQKNHSLSSTQAMFGDLNDIVCPSAAMLLTAANVAQLGWRVIQHPSFQIQEHFTGKIMYNCTGLY